MKKFKGRESIRNVAMVFVLLAAAWAQPWRLLAQNTPSPAPQPATGIKYPAISPDEMKEWLTYLASDQLQGRQIFTEGYGLAAQYVADHLRQWGVKSLASDGTYFQPVKLKAYRVTRNSTVSIEVNGQPKTFKHGDHVTFPVNGGGKQTLTFSGVEFVGYGQVNDFQGRDLKDKLIVAIPNLAPPPAVGQRGRGAAAPAVVVAAVTPSPVCPSSNDTTCNNHASCCRTQCRSRRSQSRQRWSRAWRCCRRDCTGCKGDSCIRGRNRSADCSRTGAGSGSGRADSGKCRGGSSAAGIARRSTCRRRGWRCGTRCGSGCCTGRYHHRSTC